MSPISRETLQQQFKTTNYIGLALMGSVFIYAVLVLGINLGYIPIKPRRIIDIGLSTKIKYILLVISILHYFIIRFFQKISSVSAARLPAASITIFTLSETVSIYGLVLFFLTGIYTDFFIFMTISLFYFYVFYPKYENWERLWNQESPANPPPG